MSEIEEFVNAMRTGVPDEARIILCQFRGDPAPDNPIKWKWKPHVLNDVSQIDEKANVYLCVSAMKRNERGEFRRHKRNFAGGLLLMIDDIGTGKGAKFPMSIIDPLPPTALIETSPDNYQAIYIFKEPITDPEYFDRLIKAFIKKEFLGKDTGMAGINRVFRPPAGINGKPKYDGWAVRLAEWHPENRPTPEQIIKSFDLVLPRKSNRVIVNAHIDKAEQIRAFLATHEVIRGAGMLKAKSYDLGGWQDIRCPWTDDHTGSVDNGAAIAIPSEENGWTGAFKCHHGACEKKVFRDLTEWVNDEVAHMLAMVNDQAGEFNDY